MAESSNKPEVDLRVPHQLGVSEDGVRTALDDEFVKAVVGALAEGATSIILNHKSNGPPHPKS